MSFFITILSFLATALAVAIASFFIFLKHRFGYWRKRNVPYMEPKMPFGNLSFSKNISYIIEDIYNAGKKESVFGFWFFHKPCLMINDPELIRRVLIQDFSNFSDHGTYSNPKDDPLGSHNLFAMEGSQWKNLRAKMSPTFTSGKMKMMFPIIEEISKNMVKVLTPLAEKGEIIEMKDLSGRFATDVISSVAYGIETNSLENPDSIFRQMGKRIFAANFENMMRNIITFLIPDLAKLFRIVQTDKQVSKFFMKIVKETMDYREENSEERKDFMQLLIQLKNKGIVDDVDDKTQKGDPFTFEMAAAQAFVFFLGGFETTSGALQYSTYEIAKNQDIQDRLRAEIKAEMNKAGGKLTYEGLFNLKYLGYVLDESARKYTQAVLIMRECNKDYPIPGTKIVIEKGTSVAIGAFGLHRDPRYFPEPEKFIPERFTEEEQAKRSNYVYLPFGEGPRFCIGQRFAQMQMRAAIATLLSEFKLETCEKTPEKIRFLTTSFILAPEGGIHLKITKLKD